MAGTAVAALFLIAASPSAVLTPGAVATSDPDVICHRGYSSTQRLYRTDRAAYWRLRREVFAEYRVPASEGRQFEVDDRIPLCLGGEQVLANLWAQPRFGPDNAEEKDRIEALACRAACREHTRAAILRWQNAFRGDWRRIDIPPNGW
ncbi:MAG: hypothetical protein IVW56_09575 [Candidatus Binataceae bacterium]|nr:hypothetical protein [Candidatus Binataceae bacterium]